MACHSVVGLSWGSQITTTHSWRDARYVGACLAVIGVVREEVLRLMGLGRGEEARGQEDDRDDGEGHGQSGGTYPGLRLGHVSDESEDRGRRDRSAYVLDQERQVGDVQGLVDR